MKAFAVCSEDLFRRSGLKRGGPSLCYYSSTDPPLLQVGMLYKVAISHSYKTQIPVMLHDYPLTIRIRS